MIKSYTKGNTLTDRIEIEFDAGIPLQGLETYNFVFSSITLFDSPYLCLNQTTFEIPNPHESFVISPELQSQISVTKAVATATAAATMTTMIIMRIFSSVSGEAMWIVVNQM